MPESLSVAEAAKQRARARGLQWGMLFAGTATIDFDRLLNMPLHTGMEMLYAMADWRRAQRAESEKARRLAEAEAARQQAEQSRGSFNDRMAQAMADAHAEAGDL